MKSVVFRCFSLILILWVAGCSKEQGADPSTANPSADSATLEATKAASGLKLLQNRFELEPDQVEILQQVYRLSIENRDFDAFRWALEKGAKPDLTTLGLVTVYSMGSAWRDLVLESYPESLPVFMSEAFNQSDVPFFNAHIAQLDRAAIGDSFDVKEFNTRYCRFNASLIKMAVSKKDQQQVTFLVDQLPPFSEVGEVDSRMEAALATLGKYVFEELKDEALAIKLLVLGYDCGVVDLELAGFGDAFRQAVKEHPASYIYAMGLHKEGSRLMMSDMNLLVKMPAEDMVLLHPLLVNEAIQICMKKGVSSGTQLFIRVRSAQRRLEQADYNQLMNWALKYNDTQTYNLLRKTAGDLAPEDIDLDALASNQAMFERIAPKRLNVINYTFNEKTRKEGVTLAEIYRIFENENEKAGLFVVKKYDLAKVWLGVSQGRTLLMDVCRAGNLEAAKFLIEKREADVKAETPYTKLETSVFGKSVPSEGRLTAIFFAAQSGNAELIKYLESKGASINARSNFRATPLMHAVSFGQLEATKTLVELGADVNVKMDSSVRDYVKEGRYSFGQLSSAYLRAKTMNNAEILAVLSKAGAKS